MADDYGLSIINSNNIPQVLYSDSLLCRDSYYLSEVITGNNLFSGYALFTPIELEYINGDFRWRASLAALYGIVFSGKIKILYDSALAGFSTKIYMSENNMGVYKMKLSNTSAGASGYGIVSRNKSGKINIDTSLDVCKIIDVIDINESWSSTKYATNSIAVRRTYNTPVCFVFVSTHSHDDDGPPGPFGQLTWKPDFEFVNNVFTIYRVQYSSFGYNEDPVFRRTLILVVEI